MASSRVLSRDAAPAERACTWGELERRVSRWCGATSPCPQLARGAPSCALGADQEDAVYWVVSMLVILLIESVELLP